MRNFILLFILLTVCQQVTLSQSCLPEGITFTTQAQIDNFQTNYPGCTVIEGNVDIGTSFPNYLIEDLTGLGSITKIMGHLKILYCNDLVDLSGLENLTHIGGYLKIALNNSLINLSGLSGLNKIGGYCELYGCPLTDISGLNQVDTIGGDIDLNFCNSLIVADGFEGLDYLGGNLKIYHNYHIAEILGFNSLEKISGTFYITENNDLITINGFNSLHMIGNSIQIYENDVLTEIIGFDNLNYLANEFLLYTCVYLQEIEGFNHLDSIGGAMTLINLPMLQNSSVFGDLKKIGGKLQIQNCDSYSDLSDFSNLQSIGSYITIRDNDNLLSLSGLDNLTSMNGYLYILYNDTLSSLAGIGNISPNTIDSLLIVYNPLLTACDATSVCNYLLSPNGTVTIHHNGPGCSNPPQIAASCGNVMQCLPYGNYYFNSQQDIENFPADYPGCSQLNGLVEIYGGDINNLEPFTGVSSIAGTLHIHSNYYLFVLYGLHHITSITQDLVVEYNDSMTDFDGLDVLTHIGGTFHVRGNSSLQSLNGIENLQQIDKHLLIYINEMISDLSALSNLDSIGGDLRIGNCESLNDLTGFSSLHSINGELHIYGNDMLISLQGLDNINPSSIIHLDIYDNPQLSECAIMSICEYIADPGGTINIEYNANGCNSLEEVDSVCFPVSINDLKKIPDLILYPNPASEWFTVDANEEIQEIRIYNPLGEMVLKLEIGNSEGRVDVSGLENGIYFVEVVTDEMNFKDKILIFN